MTNQVKATSEQLVKSVTNEQISGGLLLKEAKVLQPHNQPKSGPLMINGFPASRAEKMLQAALSIKNGPQPQDKRQTILEQRLIENQERLRLALLQQVEKDRKRSPKSKVFFREPVVTDQFSYEPTILQDTDTKCDLTGSDVGEKLAALRRFMQLKRAARADLQAETRISSGRLEYHGDELNLSSENKIKNIRKKRPYEMIVDHKDSETQNSTESNEDEGGLFSSPKVAKIAPYYHDSMEEQVQGLENGPSRTFSQSERSQRANKIPRMSLVGRLFNSSYQSPTSVVNKPQQPPNASTELLNMENDSDEDSSQDPQEFFDAVSSQGNYFSWISSVSNYLSSKVNKLIL